jgi:hypothetical protein
MREPRRLTTLWTFTACYRDSLSFFSMCINNSKFDLELLVWDTTNTGSQKHVLDLRFWRWQNGVWRKRAIVSEERAYYIIKVERSAETSENFYQITYHDIPERYVVHIMRYLIYFLPRKHRTNLGRRVLKLSPSFCLTPYTPGERIIDVICYIRMMSYCRVARAGQLCTSSGCRLRLRLQLLLQCFVSSLFLLPVIMLLCTLQVSSYFNQNRWAETVKVLKSRRLGWERWPLHPKF